MSLEHMAEQLPSTEPNVVVTPEVQIPKPGFLGRLLGGREPKPQVLVKPGEQIPEGISPSVEAYRKMEEDIALQERPVEIRGQLGVRSSPEWWPADLGDEQWENVELDPNERLVLGSAIAVNYYDQTLRYADRRVSVEDFNKLMAASRDFILYSEQGRLHQRHASIMDKVGEFRKHENTALDQVDPDERDEVRMDVYRLEARERRRAQLEQDGVRVGAAQHKLYTKMEWENALKEKAEIEGILPGLRGKISGKLGPNFLTERVNLQGRINAEQRRYEEEKKQKDDEIKKEDKEFDWEREFSEPDKVKYPRYKSANDVVFKQEILKLKSDLDADSYKEYKKELIGRGIAVDDSGIYNEDEHKEAEAVQEWYLNEAYRVGIFTDIEESLLDLAANYVERVAESPGELTNIERVLMEHLQNLPATNESSLNWNWLREMPTNAGADLNSFRGARGEFTSRMLRNTHTILKNLTVIESRRVSNFVPTLGIDWEKQQQDLIADQKWYELTQFNTIVFKGRGERAVGLELGAAQFAYDLIHGTSSYDPKTVQERMESFVRALSAVNIEKLVKNEGWTRDEATKFAEHIRHSTVNGASFQIINYFLENIMVDQATGYFKDFWAQEGTARLKDLLQENKGMMPLVMHLLLTKYQMIMASGGLQGQFVGKEHVQWELQSNLKEVLIREAMDWEMIISDELKNNPNLTEREKEYKALEGLTIIKSERDVKSRYQTKADSPSKVLRGKRENYRRLADILDQRKKAGEDVTEDEVKALKRARVELTEAKKIYNKSYQNVSSALDLVIKVFRTFGISAEINAPLFVAEKGDHVNINDFTKALKFASLDAGEKEFKDKYGFIDNMSLIRARSMAWNASFAESAATLNAWETIESRVRAVNSVFGGGSLENLIKRLDNLNEGDRLKLISLGIPESFFELEVELTSFYLKIENELRKKGDDYKNKKLIDEIRRLTRPEARESFVTAEVTKEDGSKEKVRFDLAKGYEWTGLTQEEFDSGIKEARDQIKLDGYSAVIKGVALRDILAKDDLEPVLNNFFALYEGTRAELNSEEAIEAAARGENVWLAINRNKLAKTGRKGFVGLETVGGTKQNQANEYSLAIAESVSFDENHSQLAYVLTTTGEDGNFNPDGLTYGRYDGKARNDYYVGLALTTLGVEVGRFPEIIRRLPLHPKPLPKEMGFKTITELVGNSTGFDPLDNWSIITYGMRQEAMQAEQRYYKGDFDKEFKFDFAAGDKLIDDGDQLRAAEFKALFNTYKTLDKVIAALIAGEEPITDDNEEQMIEALLERERRIVRMLGPIAQYYQNARGADEAGLGLEFNDSFHNSAIMPVLLSKGREGGRIAEGGLKAYASIAEILLFATFPKGYDNTESFIKHGYGKIRQARTPVLLGGPVIVRV